MEKIEFIVNNRVEIIWNKEAYKSTIQDIKNKEFAISIPTRDGEYLPLKAGDTVEVLYYLDLNIFQFDSKVIGRAVEGIPVIFLEVPEKYTVVQRRQYFRVNKFDFIEIALYNKLYNDGDIEINHGEKIIRKVVLLDISGGGMKIKLDEQVSLNDTIHCVLKTPKEDIDVYGKVVRIEKDELNSYLCGISFIDLTQKMRDKIIQYTFELVRAQRSKGL